jgi:hypothetical protein
LVTGTKRPILQHTRLEESINDPQQPWIANAMSEKTPEMVVRNLVKETLDVRLDEPLRTLHRYDLR